jgi:antibiotic biosynthesis monooxygenase (ABM) superfamily enzyme
MAGQTAHGLLAVWTDIAPEAEREFNEWYNTEHVPQLLGVPGFLSGRRYQAVEGEPKYLALYELAIPEVLKSDAFRQVRESPTAWSKKIIPLFRNTVIGAYRQLFSCNNHPAPEAEFVLTVRLNIPAEKEEEFNQWYNIDHLPALVGVPGVSGARRYQAVEGDAKYLAVYEMNAADIPKSAAWDKARNTDWTQRMRPHLKDPRVVLSRRIYP